MLLYRQEEDRGKFVRIRTFMCHTYRRQTHCTHAMMDAMNGMVGVDPTTPVHLGTADLSHTRVTTLQELYPCRSVYEGIGQ